MTNSSGVKSVVVRVWKPHLFMCSTCRQAEALSVVLLGSDSGLFPENSMRNDSEISSERENHVVIPVPVTVSYELNKQGNVSNTFHCLFADYAVMFWSVFLAEDKYDGRRHWVGCSVTPYWAPNAPRLFRGFSSYLARPWTPRMLPGEDIYFQMLLTNRNLN